MKIFIAQFISDDFVKMLALFDLLKNKLADAIVVKPSELLRRSFINLI